MTTLAMIIRIGSLAALVFGIVTIVRGPVLGGVGLIVLSVTLHFVTNGLLGVAYRMALDKYVRGEQLSEDEQRLLSSRRMGPE